MTPAREPPPQRDGVRLLAVDPRSGAVRDGTIADLPELVRPGDLLVVNDAATLPASLRGRAPPGEVIELRLVAPVEDGGRVGAEVPPPRPSPRGGRGSCDVWRAVVFGAGDWRVPTEARPAPPDLPVGTALDLDGLTAVVAGRSAISPRLIDVRFDRGGAALWRALYERGAPVQYAYTSRPFDLWSVQTTFAARPWAVEMPSAGRPLSWRVLRQLTRRGARLASVTHAAGLSATGDPAIDAALPFPERYDVPAATVAAVDATRADGGRVIAAGTTVVRALEGCAAANGGRLVAGPGTTDLVIGPRFAPRVVDGLLTGMHDPSESHWRLLTAFAPERHLACAYEHAVARGYRCHEMGDATLVLPPAPAAARGYAPCGGASSDYLAMT